MDIAIWDVVRWLVLILSEIMYFMIGALDGMVLLKYENVDLSLWWFVETGLYLAIALNFASDVFGLMTPTKDEVSKLKKDKDGD